MKTPEWATDETLLRDMIVACEEELDKIKKEIADYIPKHELKFGIAETWEHKETGEYFLQKCVELHFKKDIDKTQRAIKQIAMEIAKQKQKIDTQDWERQVEHAKEVPIDSIVRHYIGHDNPRRRAKCPFHVSKQGGGKHLQVYPKNNTFRCFSCGACGDGIAFVMKYDNCDFKEAVEKLKFL